MQLKEHLHLTQSVFVCGQFIVPLTDLDVEQYVILLGFLFLHRFYSHHSNQSNMAHKDPSTAGC